MSTPPKEDVKEEVDNDDKDKELDFHKKAKGKRVRHYIISEQRDFYKKKISELNSTIAELNSTIESKDKEIEDFKTIINFKNKVIDQLKTTKST